MRNSLFLLMAAPVLLFSCRKDEAAVKTSNSEYVLEKTIRTDGANNAYREITTVFGYDHLKRVISVSEFNNSANPSLYPLYQLNRNVFYNGNEAQPYKSTRFFRGLPPGNNWVPAHIADTAVFYYFYDAQNRKIKDSVVYGSFNINTAVFTQKSVYVANYTYGNGIIYSSATDRLSTGITEQIFDTAFSDNNGNIREIHSNRRKLDIFFVASHDDMNNPYHRLKDLYLLIPDLEGSHSPGIEMDAVSRFIGKNNVKAYSENHIGKGPWSGMLACGTDSHNHQYNTDLYPGRLTSFMLGSMQFFYKWI